LHGLDGQPELFNKNVLDQMLPRPFGKLAVDQALKLEHLTAGIQQVTWVIAQ